MREIKFRVWNTRLKIMSESFNPLNKMYEVVFENTPYDDQELLDFKHCLFMQYTGLKDKNGVEIYEGDILTLDGGKHCFSVAFYDGAFSAKRVDGKQGASLQYLFGNDNPSEILGNIYENPELLKAAA